MMKKRNAATMMAAAMTLATVAPAFAGTVTFTNAGTVDTELAKGRKVDNLKYDAVYNTNFTTDKKDDTLKTGFEVLQVITAAATNSNTDGEYLVSVPMTAKELEDNKVAIATAKLKLAEMDAEIKHKLTLKFVDANNVTRDVYTIQPTVENKAKTTEKTNNKTVRLINNQVADTGLEYVYNNVTIESKTDSAAIDANATKIDLVTDPTVGYKALSKKMFELEKMKDITIAKSEKNSTTLLMRVYDAKKTHIETIEVAGYTNATESKMVKISGNSDFANHWAETTIFDAMYNETVALSTQFRPNDNITRAEFIKIVNKTFFANGAKAQKETFADVDSSNWFYDDVLVAVNAGYINGYEDGTLRPNQTITRQEAAAIVAKIVKPGVETTAADVNGKLVDTDVQTKFKDDKEIAVWADESVKELSTEKTVGTEKITVINGYSDGNFKPKNNITRAEALTIMEKGNLVKP